MEGKVTPGSSLLSILFLFSPSTLPFSDEFILETGCTRYGKGNKRAQWIEKEISTKWREKWKYLHRKLKFI